MDPKIRELQRKSQQDPSYRIELYNIVKRLDIFPSMTYEKDADFNTGWHRFMRLFAYLGDNQAKQIVKAFKIDGVWIANKESIWSHPFLMQIGLAPLLVMGIGAAEYIANQPEFKSRNLPAAISYAVNNIEKAIQDSETAWEIAGFQRNVFRKVGLWINYQEPEYLNIVEENENRLRESLNTTNIVAMGFAGTANIDLAVHFLFRGLAELTCACLHSWSESITTAMDGITYLREALYVLQYNQAEASKILRTGMQKVIPWATNGIVS